MSTTSPTLLPRPARLAALLLCGAALLLLLFGCLWVDGEAGNAAELRESELRLELGATVTAAAGRIAAWLSACQVGTLFDLPFPYDYTVAAYRSGGAPPAFPGFEEAERLEFVVVDRLGALAAYRRLTTPDHSPAVRVRALRNLARLSLEAGERPAGLDALRRAGAILEAPDSERFFALYELALASGSGAVELRADIARGEFAAVPPGQRLALYEELGGSREELPALEALEKIVASGSANEVVLVAPGRVAFPSVTDPARGETAFAIARLDDVLDAALPGFATGRWRHGMPGAFPRGEPLDGFRPALAVDLGAASIELVKQERRRTFWSWLVLPAGVTLLLLGAALALILVARRQALLDRRKSDFICAVTHELKTPLANIRMFAETLAATAQDEAETRERFSGIIVTEADRLAERIQQVLDVAAGSSLPGAEVTFDPRPLVEDTVLELRDAAAGRGVEIVHHRAPSCPPLRGSPALFRKAVYGALDNAVKFGAAGPVEVTLESAGDTVRILVADRGPGIPPADRERVFEPFVRLEDEMTRRTAGTGLGLTLVRQCALACHGRVRVLGRKNGGTELCMEFPARMTTE